MFRPPRPRPRNACHAISSSSKRASIADLADELVKGATAELEQRGATFERISVPGVLEIPAALAMALKAEASERAIDGYVLLGCVIRGETTHYDIVANESARAIMDLAVGERAGGRQRHPHRRERRAGLGARAVSEKNKGAAAAAAAFEMAALREKLGLAHG